jgi:peptidyl-prolyl cis-trans isomerase D
MSKKSQTTGQPKRRKRRNPNAPIENVENTGQAETKADFRSRAEREEEVQQKVVRGVGITVGILIVIILAAFIVEQLIVPNQTVAVVNGESISAGQFREAVSFERSRLELQFSQIQSAGLDIQQIAQQEPYATWLNELNVPDQLGLRVLNDMVDDILIRQEAAERSVTVNDEAVAEQINSFFGYDPTEVALIGVEPTQTDVPTETPTPFVSPTPSPTPTTTPTLSPEETQEVVEPTLTAQPTVIVPTLAPDEVVENFESSQDNFRSYFSSAGVGGGLVDAFFERQALETLLADNVFGEAETLLFADVRHILVETEETALEVMDALQNGESFADLARAVSTDTGSGSRGGELGDSYVGNYVPEFRAAVETAEIGALVGPVESEFGYHIIQVRSSEERSGEDVEAQLESAKQREFGLFLEELRESNTDNIELYDNWIDFVPRS